MKMMAPLRMMPNGRAMSRGDRDGLSTLSHCSSRMLASFCLLSLGHETAMARKSMMKPKYWRTNVSCGIHFLDFYDWWFEGSLAWKAEHDVGGYDACIDYFDNH
jgi:hypothetical protein